MKKILLILCFALSADSVFAKKIHFTDSVNNWIMGGFDCNIQPIYGHCNYTKDTVMNGYLYRYLNDSLINTECMFGICDTIFGYWVREDTVENIVYVWFNDTDQILYDFNANFGGHCDYSFLPNHFNYIDSVMYKDSTVIDSEKYFFWANNEIDFFWHYYYPDTCDSFCVSRQHASFDFIIEGIGHNRGPLMPINIIYGLNNNQVLNCFYRTGGGADTPWFHCYNPGGFYVNCDSTENVRYFMNTNPLSTNIQPNPANSETRIVFSKKIMNGYVQVYNDIGELIINTSVYEKDSYPIGSSLNRTGIYYYKITDNETGKILGGKFVFIE